MMIIGITGGIGSGKSMVSALFSLHGIPVFDADSEAKTLCDTAPEVRESLIRRFGNDLYQGELLDRKKLAALIFHDNAAMEIANSIIHTALMQRYEHWCREKADYPLTAIEAAILIESGFEQYVDEIITVYAPLELRIGRAMQRDGAEREEIEARIAAQLPEEEKIKRSHYVIYNDERGSLIQQVAEYLGRFPSQNRQMNSQNNYFSVC